MSTHENEQRGHSRLEFNIVLSSTVAVSLVFLFVSAVFGSSVVDMLEDEEQSNTVRVPVWERNTLP